MATFFFGVTNIGRRPTIENDAPTDIVETYIFDFDEDIYGLDLELEFVERIRDERKFSDLQALKVQLEADKVNSLKYFL